MGDDAGSPSGQIPLRRYCMQYRLLLRYAVAQLLRYASGHLGVVFQQAEENAHDLAGFYARVEGEPLEEMVLAP